MQTQCLLRSKSGILVSAICCTCARVTVATFVLLGVPEPFSTPAAFFQRTAAGGVLVTKVNDLSSYTEITTGMIIPAWSAVRALNSLVNPMMLIPA